MKTLIWPTWPFPSFSQLFLPEFSCSTAPSGASHVFIMFCSDSSQLIAATTIAGGVFVRVTIQMTIQDFEYWVATPRSQFSTYSVKRLTPSALSLFIMSSYTYSPLNEEANESRLLTLLSGRFLGKSASCSTGHPSPPAKFWYLKPSPILGAHRKIQFQSTSLLQRGTLNWCGT